MTLSEINELAAERRAIRELLNRWRVLARPRPVEADEVSKQIAGIVESPLTLSPAERLSPIWVAPVLWEALQFFASDPSAWPRPLDWPNRVSCYSLRTLHPEYRKRLDSLLLPMELLLVEPLEKTA